jgi:hypothetical protein
MPIVPMICEEIKKPTMRFERVALNSNTQKANVRPEVASLIKKVIKENAPTWQALAKR